MSTWSPADAFRLGRLRLIRLPPASLHLPASIKKAQTVIVELAAGVTDDYGVDLQFDSLDVRVDVLDARTFEPPIGVTLQLDGTQPSSSKPSAHATFAFTPVRGPFYTLKVVLAFSALFATQTPPAQLCFRLSSSRSPTLSASQPSPTPSTSAVRTLIGEPTQQPTETWDDRRFVFLGVTSGPMEVRIEGREAKVSQDKVQTALRLIRLPPNASPTDSPPTAISAPLPAPTSSRTITIVERPGLNNSTGQRLWDCAIGLSAYLSLHPAALDASQPLPPFQAEVPSDRPAKKARVALPAEKQQRRRTRVVELGAGCALASLAAAEALRSTGARHASVLATDVEATVETTLRENLVANAGLGSAGPGGLAIHADVLDWGELSSVQVDRVVDGATNLTLLGTDILYNPSSHELLRTTLLSVLRPPPLSTASPSSPLNRRALIAYKRRTDGDDAFFDLARRSGLEVRRVWEWGEVSVWSFE